MTRVISSSSIELWKRCNRRWAFHYIQGLDEPSGDAAEAGKRVHALLETETIVEVPLWGDYDITKMAHALKKHEPEDTPIGREVSFERELHGIMFKGIIDRLSAEYIVDWKTISSQLKYVKKKLALRRTVQRLVYSEAFPDVPFTRWVTGTWATSPAAILDPATSPFDTVAVTVDRNVELDTEAFKEFVLAPAEEIARVEPGVDPLSFPLPENAFSAFDSPCKMFQPDGCPYHERCHGPRTRLSTALTEKVRLPVLSAAENVLEAVTEVVANPASLAVVDSTPEFLIENLYLDCMPLFQTEPALTYAAPLLFAAASEIEIDLQVRHVMLMDFAKGPPTLAVELVAQIEQIAPIQHLYLETRSAEGRGVMQTLMGRSRRVYRGL